jgi:hypothetical protein
MGILNDLTKCLKHASLLRCSDGFIVDWLLKSLPHLEEKKHLKDSWCLSHHMQN